MIKDRFVDVTKTTRVTKSPVTKTHAPVTAAAGETLEDRSHREFVRDHGSALKIGRPKSVHAMTPAERQAKRRAKAKAVPA